MKAWIVIASSLALLGSGGAWADTVTDGQVYFKANCALCHDVSPAVKNGQGPGLFDVVGRKVGAAKGFDYSAPLKAANGKGQVWTAAGLNGFLAGVFSPIKKLPIYLDVISRISPMRYAVDLVRGVFYADKADHDKVVLASVPFNLLIVLGGFTVAMIAGTYLFVRAERNR